MANDQLPQHFQRMKRRFPDVIEASEGLGKAAKEAGPIDEKTVHLIQMAASAAIRSHGAVHSHARRALEAGATSDELYHAIIALISTLGLPVVAAAIGWIDDVVGGAE